MAQIALGALSTLNLSTHLDPMFTELYHGDLPRVDAGSGASASTSMRGTRVVISGNFTLLPLATGARFSLLNASGSSVSVLIGSGMSTCVVAGNPTSGTRTLAAYSIAEVWYSSASDAWMTGAGVT